MGLDFSRPPTDVFHMPSIHAGMHYVPPPPDWVLRAVPSADVRMFAASDSDPVLEVQQSAIDRQEQRLLGSIMEINSAPVVLTRAEFRSFFATIDGRLWLNGASGDRLRHQFDTHIKDDTRRDFLRAAFRRARERGDYQPPVWSDDARGLEVALGLMHGVSHPRAVTGLLSGLAHFAQDGSDAAINLHVPAGYFRDEIWAFAAAVFPGLLPRIRFRTGAGRYQAVRAAFSHRHYLYQVRDQRTDTSLQHAAEPGWHKPRSTTRHRRAVAAASYDSGLRLLRDAAIASLSRQALGPLPKRLWLLPGPNAPVIDGQAVLLQQLQARGFQPVYLPALPPLQRIAAMQAADVVVAPYGAGLDLMAYARPDTLILHLATRQTQAQGWGDLLPLAHVARCRYYTVFADMAGMDCPDDLPPRATTAALSLGRRATDRILNVIDKDTQTRSPQVAFA